MNDKAIDSIIKSDIILEVHSSFVILVSCDIDSLAVYYEVLIPGTIFGNYFSTSSGKRRHEKWHEVTVSINHIVCNIAYTCALSLCKYNSTRGGSCPPHVSIDEVTINCDIV